MKNIDALAPLLGHHELTQARLWIERNLAPILAEQDIPNVDLGEETHQERAVFSVSFHHGGQSYTSHMVKVTASLQTGLIIRVTGSDRDNAQKRIADAFGTFLMAEFQN
jgi:hypothetical protein